MPLQKFEIPAPEADLPPGGAPGPLEGGIEGGRSPEGRVHVLEKDGVRPEIEAEGGIAVPFPEPPPEKGGPPGKAESRSAVPEGEPGDFRRPVGPHGSLHRDVADGIRAVPQPPPLAGQSERGFPEGPRGGHRQIAASPGGNEPGKDGNPGEVPRLSVKFSAEDALFRWLRALNASTPS